MKSILHSKSGQGMVEYILIVGLIALFCFIAVQTFGTKISQSFQAAAGKVPTSWGQ